MVKPSNKQELRERVVTKALAISNKQLVTAQGKELSKREKRAMQLHKKRQMELSKVVEKRELALYQEQKQKKKGFDFSLDTAWDKGLAMVVILCASLIAFSGYNPHFLKVAIALGVLIVGVALLVVVNKFTLIHHAMSKFMAEKKQDNYPQKETKEVKRKRMVKQHFDSLGYDTTKVLNTEAVPLLEE